MDIWIIAVIVAGGVIVLGLLALIIYRCCCRRRKGKNNKRDVKGQNGHVWQAHDKDVELADEEDPQGKMKEDGLCKETEAGSTFPRRIKAEDPNPEPPKKDGLCEDTEKRFTYPRRGRPENELLLPTDDKNLSTSETALKSVVPVGFSVITSFEGKETQDKLRTKSEVQVHRSKQDTPKDKGEDKESSSDSSSDSDNDEKQRNGAQHLIKHSDKKGRKVKRAKSVVERKRSKSLHNSLEEIPEYSKPIKRSVSNPSFVARERMIQKDARFQSLETWRSTIPIPERDYPKDISSARLHEDDQDNAPPSYATSDSGVECLDALSGHDDESINHCDSVPESPGLPSHLKDETSFSSSYKERAEMRYQESKHIMNTADHGINGFQGNAVVMTTKDHTTLIDANAVKDSPSPFGVNQQGIFFQSTPTENKPRDVSSPYRDPKLALRNTPSPASNSVSSSGRSTTERIQTKDAEQMDFRSVKLRPTSTNYDQSHTFMIYGSNHGYTGATPSEKEKEHLTIAEQQKPKIQDMASTQTIVIDNATDGPKDHYILPGSKTQVKHVEKNVTQINSPDTDKSIDFHSVHLRHVQTPQSRIASREEMETQASDKTEKESETVIGVHDGIKRFQSQGAQIPKPMFGSHYVSKKDTSQKPVSIVSKEPAPNSKPVSIVAPEPSMINRETHTTTTTTLRNVREVKANQNGNVHTIINKNERTRPVSVINESVVSEDRRHFRYSTGIVNQSHVTLGFKDAPQKTITGIRGSDEDENTNTTFNKQDSLEKRHSLYSTGNDNQSHISLGFKDTPQKTITVIRGLDEDENTKTTSNKQGSLEKPVAVIPPQSPKAKRESPEERAVFEEERKKNWKREQIEQKLTSAHMRSVQNKNDQILQASGLALRSVMPELFTKIKQRGEEKEAPIQ